MGQACGNTVLSCADCNIISTNEFISEPSIRFNSSIRNLSFKLEGKEPPIKCIENLEERLNMYEKEIQDTKAEIFREKLRAGEQEKTLSPQKTRIISSNFSEKSLNLIERVSKTSDTDKSFSSMSHS